MHREWTLNAQKPSRRNFLFGAAAAMASHRVWALSAAMPIGLQLYSVSAELQKDTFGTLKTLRDIGYTRVETSGFAGLTAPEFRAQLDRADLTCNSAHMPFGPDDPQPLFEQAHAVGAHFVVSSGQLSKKSGRADTTLDEYAAMAERLNVLGKKARQAGLQYAYHNHNFEFRKLEGDHIGYDVILAKTDPELVAFELDWGWAVAAGASPAAYFIQYPGRFRMLHVKDFEPTAGTSTSLDQDKRPRGTELGRGHIDYRPILTAAVKAGIHDFYIEQEPPFVEMPALAAVRMDFNALRALPLGAS